MTLPCPPGEFPILIYGHFRKNTRNTREFRWPRCAKSGRNNYNDITTKSPVLYRHGPRISYVPICRARGRIARVSCDSFHESIGCPVPEASARAEISRKCARIRGRRAYPNRRSVTRCGRLDFKAGFSQARYSLEMKSVFYKPKTLYSVISDKGIIWRIQYDCRNIRLMK